MLPYGESRGQGVGHHRLTLLVLHSLTHSLVVGGIAEHYELFRVPDAHEMVQDIGVIADVSLRAWVLVGKLGARLVLVDSEDFNINLNVLAFYLFFFRFLALCDYISTANFLRELQSQV